MYFQQTSSKEKSKSTEATKDSDARKTDIPELEEEEQQSSIQVAEGVPQRENDICKTEIPESQQEEEQQIQIAKDVPHTIKVENDIKYPPRTFDAEEKANIGTESDDVIEPAEDDGQTEIVQEKESDVNGEEEKTAATESGNVQGESKKEKKRSKYHFLRS